MILASAVRHRKEGRGPPAGRESARLPLSPGPGSAASLAALRRFQETHLISLSLPVVGAVVLALAAVVRHPTPAQAQVPRAPAPAAASAPVPRLDSAGLPAATVARIDSAITAFMARERIPGLSIAVATGNQVRWEQGYGFADLENFVPATAATVYRLASVSKPITAVAVMQLAERGSLDLDVPIQRYVPSFPAKRYPVTARQLLSHLAGVRHYKGDEWESTRPYPNLTAGLAMFEDDSLEHAPGARMTYTTHGYTLLGAAVEGAARMPYMDYLRAHVLAPAGISAMRDDDVAALIPHRARAYARDSTGALRNAGLANTSYKIPGGGLVSTAADVARFAVAVQSGRIVRPATFARMTTPARTTDGKAIGYGLGWTIGQIPTAPPGVVWHSGGQQGTSSMVYLLPNDGTVVAILTNLEGLGAALQASANDVARIVREGAARQAR